MLGKKYKNYNCAIMKIQFKNFTFRSSISPDEIKIEPITEPVLFGEGPHWSALHKCLYFIDIDGGIILKYNHSDGILSKIFVPPGDNPVTFVIPNAGEC